MQLIVAISGYNGSGKSYLCKSIIARMQSCEVPCRLVYFDKLYPSEYITKKKKKRVDANSDKGLGLRQIEGQKGNWDQPLGWFRFVNILGAIAATWVVRLLNRRTVVVFERYFYDRYANFDANGLLYRIVYKLTPRPTFSFILIPEQAIWEQRIIARIEKRYGIKLQTLADPDRAELLMVRKKYEEFAISDPWVIDIDSTSGAGSDAVWCILASHLHITIEGDTPSSAVRARHKN